MKTFFKMRIFNKFVWSDKEPNNKNDIWFDGSVWKMFSQGEWEAFTVEKEAATKINKLIEDSFGVYQEKLTAGDGVIIENNIISTEKLYQVVKTLPDKGKHNTIYLVSSKNTEENNILTEYIWVNNDWEKLGEFKTDIDLTSYLTKTEAQTTYQPQEKGKGLSTNDFTTAEKNKLASLENYDDSGIKKDLAKKAEKSEIPTKMSQLEQDIEIGTSYDDTEVKNELARLEREKADKSELTDYLTKEEFNEVSERFASADRVQELSEDVTELSEEVSGLSEKIENLPSAEDEILVVEYGKTTFQEVHDAYYAGKYIIFEFANNVFHINRVTASDIYFISVNGTIVYRIGLNSSNNWYQNTIQNEQSTNKVTTLSESSTDTQYPSAKAVYDFVGKQGVVSQLQGWSMQNGVYSYTMRNVVRGAIPQANIDLFTRVGAVFNEETGYFEFNGLTDISYEEMMDIYTYGNVPTLPNIEQYHPIKNIRTTLPIRANNYYNQSMSPSFEYATVESLFLTNNVSPVNAEGLGNGAKYLHTLVIPDYSRGKKFWSAIKQLRTCLIAKIKVNIELHSSYQLTNESILYMIQNEIATSAIVITLHADAYARAMADAEITAALETHPNVSLASA